MAFVNAYLTDEEKRIIEDAGIRDPRYKISKKYLKPSKWTIDREKNIVLINCGVADRDEYYKETFALIYKQMDNAHLVALTLTTDYFEKEKEKILLSEYGVSLIKKWIVIDYTIAEGLNISNWELHDVLVEALTAYGINGKPNSVQSVKAFVEFE
jgi:hypothetical protein